MGLRQKVKLQRMAVDSVFERPEFCIDRRTSQSQGVRIRIARKTLGYRSNYADSSC